ncbi:origin recognition complex subunit [Reticulomyxa filosa]|uniref:Origin recognition complex subunit 1 n=1 Tax=Reticulomyxa filosa TaxID=46433 RepID=X6NJ49_RETFI|nr:origin recognition complex subunit [Reticulomyxa filosa]|eukprot:ETO25913.1 origin recognition complex subunit [Reticulomyxa filosa]
MCNGIANKETEGTHLYISLLNLKETKQIQSDVFVVYADKKKCAPTSALKKLDSYFSAKYRKDEEVTVLLIDELDYLLTRKQNVIYNLFDWPTRKNAHLVMIGISNTMDLPERLTPRVSSRIGLQRILFKPYNREQLKQIIQSRLECLEVFTPDAIAYCASTVASVSGDCRTALQICRRAIEVTLKRIAHPGQEEEEDEKEEGKTTHDNDSDPLLPNDFAQHHSRKRAKKSIHQRLSTTEPEIATHTDTGLFNIIFIMYIIPICSFFLPFNCALAHFVSSDKFVQISDVKKAKTHFDGSIDVQIIHNLAIFEKLLLTAILIYNRINRVLSATLEEYKTRLDGYLDTHIGESRLTVIEMQGILERLRDTGVISIIFNQKESKTWIRMNSQEDDCLSYLILELLLEQLYSLFIHTPLFIINIVKK